MALLMTNKRSIWQLRDQIVDASLTHITFDGWTMAALNRGAEDIGLPRRDITRAFPAGAIDAIEHHSRACRPAHARSAYRPRHDAYKSAHRNCRTQTLEQNIPHREAVRRACAMLALPQNAPMAARCLYRTVDAIWRAAGDTATDWNFIPNARF